MVDDFLNVIIILGPMAKDGALEARPDKTPTLLFHFF